MTDNTNDIVISTSNLCKVYKLYLSPQDRLKEALHPRRKKYHKDFFALKDLNLEIRRGEVIGIVGKNGSGKSTLLKILSRVLTPNSGEFMVKGKVSSLLELGSGFNPELTGMENIFFYGTILGFSEEKIKGKLQEILDFADIGDFVYQPLKTYSSGMKARLAFSVAVNVDPDILILDEVLAVGDELFRRKCYARMEKFFQGGKTILYVSHDLSSINQFCSRAIMLDRGQLIIEGPPKLITNQYQKYLFSEPGKKDAVMREITAMNNDISIKRAVYDEINSLEKKQDQIRQSYDEPHKRQKSNTTKPKQKPFFIPGLIPKSRVEYRNQDVDIADVQITTLEGEDVNVLVSGQEYVFQYKVKFNIQAENVGFGMMIKTESGSNLSGSSSRKFDQIIKNVTKNQTIRVQWKFQCNLLSGTYYVNAGITTIKGTEGVFLNRIVDAMAFRVLLPEDNKYSGIANLYQNLNIITV